MAISKVKALQTAIRSFKTTVQSDAPEKSKHVSIPLAEHYNSLVEKAAAFTEIKEHLPPPIQMGGMFETVGVTNAQYTDLMVYLNQLMELTDMIEDENAA